MESGAMVELVAIDDDVAEDIVNGNLRFNNIWRYFLTD